MVFVQVANKIIFLKNLYDLLQTRIRIFVVYCVHTKNKYQSKATEKVFRKVDNFPK